MQIYKHVINNMYSQNCKMKNNQEMEHTSLKFSLNKIILKVWHFYEYKLSELI